MQYLEDDTMLYIIWEGMLCNWRSFYQQNLVIIVYIYTQAHGVYMYVYVYPFVM